MPNELSNTRSTKPVRNANAEAAAKRPCPSSCARLWDRLLSSAETRKPTSPSIENSSGLEKFTYAPRPHCNDDHLRRSFELALTKEGLQVTADFNLPVDSLPTTQPKTPRPQPSHQQSRHRSSKPLSRAQVANVAGSAGVDVGDDDDGHHKSGSEMFKIKPALQLPKPRNPAPNKTTDPLSKLPPSDFMLIQQKAKAPEPQLDIPLRERLRNDAQMVSDDDDSMSVDDSEIPANTRHVSGSYRAVPSPSQSPSERRRLSKTTNASPKTHSPRQKALSLAKFSERNNSQENAKGPKSKPLNGVAGPFSDDEYDEDVSGDLAEDSHGASPIAEGSQGLRETGHSFPWCAAQKSLSSNDLSPDQSTGSHNDDVVAKSEASRLRQRRSQRRQSRCLTQPDPSNVFPDGASKPNKDVKIDLLTERRGSNMLWIPKMEDQIQSAPIVVDGSDSGEVQWIKTNPKETRADSEVNCNTTAKRTPDKHRIRRRTIRQQDISDDDQNLEVNLLGNHCIQNREINSDDPLSAVFKPPSTPLRAETKAGGPELCGDGEANNELDSPSKESPIDELQAAKKRLKRRLLDCAREDESGFARDPSEKVTKQSSSSPEKRMDGPPFKKRKITDGKGRALFEKRRRSRTVKQFPPKPHSKQSANIYFVSDGSWTTRPAQSPRITRPVRGQKYVSSAMELVVDEGRGDHSTDKPTATPNSKVPIVIVDGVDNEPSSLKNPFLLPEPTDVKNVRHPEKESKPTSAISLDSDGSGNIRSTGAALEKDGENGAVLSQPASTADQAIRRRSARLGPQGSPDSHDVASKVQYPGAEFNMVVAECQDEPVGQEKILFESVGVIQNLSGQDSTQDFVPTPDSSFGGLISSQTSSKLQKKMNSLPPTTTNNDAVHSAVLVLRSAVEANPTIENSPVMPAENSVEIGSKPRLPARLGDKSVGQVQSEKTLVPPFGKRIQGKIQSQSPVRMRMRSKRIRQKNTNPGKLPNAGGTPSRKEVGNKKKGSSPSQKSSSPEKNMSVRRKRGPRARKSDGNLKLSESLQVRRANLKRRRMVDEEVEGVRQELSARTISDDHHMDLDSPKSPARKRPCLHATGRKPAMAAWNIVVDVEASVMVDSVSPSPPMSAAPSAVLNSEAKSLTKNGNSGEVRHSETKAPPEDIHSPRHRGRAELARRLDIPRKQKEPCGGVDSMETKRRQAEGEVNVVGNGDDGDDGDDDDDVDSGSKDSEEGKETPDDDQPVRRRYGTVGSLKKRINVMATPVWEDFTGGGGSSISSSLPEAGANAQGMQTISSEDEQLHRSLFGAHPVGDSKAKPDMNANMNKPDANKQVKNDEDIKAAAPERRIGANDSLAAEKETNEEGPEVTSDNMDVDGDLRDDSNKVASEDAGPVQSVLLRLRRRAAKS